MNSRVGLKSFIEFLISVALKYKTYFNFESLKLMGGACSWIYLDFNKSIFSTEHDLFLHPVFPQTAV